MVLEIKNMPDLCLLIPWPEACSYLFIIQQPLHCKPLKDVCPTNSQAIAGKEEMGNEGLPLATLTHMILPPNSVQHLRIHFNRNDL